jgi:hypothetical protein
MHTFYWLSVNVCFRDSEQLRCQISRGDPVVEKIFERAWKRLRANHALLPGRQKFAGRKNLRRKIFG